MNKRKMTSIALVAAVAISTVQLAYPADVFAHEQVNETSISEKYNYSKDISKTVLANAVEVGDENTLIEKLNNASTDEKNPTVISITEDISLTKQLVIKKDTYVEIIGNGHSIYRDDSYTVREKQEGDTIEPSETMISIEGDLVTRNVILDAKCNEKVNGFRVIRLLKKLDMYETIIQNGYLSDETTAGGAGVSMAGENSELNMYSGAIRNGRGVNSGAVFIAEDGSVFNMYGGEISNNIGTGCTSGVHAYNDKVKANLLGGKIINNTSKIDSSDTRGGGAVYVNGQDSLYISGDVEMYGNKTIYTNGINVNVPNGTEVDVDIFATSGGKENSLPIITSKLKNKMNIHILEGKAYIDKRILKGSDSYTLDEEDASKVTAVSLGNQNYGSVLNGNTIERHEGINIKFESNYEGGNSYTKAVAKGREVVIPSNEFVRDRYVFVGWSETPDGEVVYKEGDKIKVSEENKTLYAKWEDAVATVNKVGYTSVQEAIGKAGKGDTVSVIKKDIELEKALDIANKEGIIIDFHNANVSMKNATQKETVKSLINITNSKNIKIVNANLELSKDERRINVAKGSDVTVAETKFITDKVASEAPKSAILVENDAKVTISGKVSTEKESTEGKKETFPVVELTDKTSEIRVDANSIINGHEIPSIGEVGTNSGSNDIVFDNNVNNDITLDDVLHDILDDKTNDQIVAKIVEETTTNSIKINTWDLGLKDEVYGIVETKNATNNNRITPINGWKEPEGKFVTFDGLSSGKEYTIYIKGNDKDNTAEVKIEKIVPSVKTKESSGGGSVPSIPSTPSKPSKPVYTHKEVIGANRYETAAKVADELGSYDNVVLVNATSTMSDGLAASGLAGKENGAILLTKKDSIPKATMDRIKKVKKVYIIGGENAISQKVANQITAANIKVERIGGKNRVETSELVAEKLGNYSNAFIVNGFKGEADAMSASAIAARYEAPILLTNGKTSTHAKKSGVEYYVVGGTSVVNKSIADKYNAERLAGKDRYATNREVIDEFYSGSDKLYLANGETLVDALTASTIAKNHGIVLVNKKSDNSVLKDKNTVQIGGMNFDIDFE